MTFRRATIQDYMHFLYPYFLRGGVPTHYYPYPFVDATDFLYATNSFRLGNECGAEARCIIVPYTVWHYGGRVGHSSLFFYEGWRAVGRHVPVFSDPVFQEFSQTQELRSRLRREAAEYDARRERERLEANLEKAQSDLTRYLTWYQDKARHDKRVRP